MRGLSGTRSWLPSAPKPTTNPLPPHSASNRVNDVILTINTREVAFFGHTDVLEVLKFFVANPSSPVGGMALTVLQVRPPFALPLDHLKCYDTPPPPPPPPPPPCNPKLKLCCAVALAVSR